MRLLFLPFNKLKTMIVPANIKVIEPKHIVTKINDHFIKVQITLPMMKRILIVVSMIFFN